MDKVKFIESSHRYISSKGEMISVSKFFDQFKEKVDWGTIAQRVAAKLTKEGTPTTKQDVLKKWENKRVKSSQIGSKFHAIRENDLINGVSDCNYYDNACQVIKPIYEKGDKYSFPIQELQNNTIYPELMIYDFDYMICGQSDKVIVAKNKINIWDYKTDQTIEFKAWSNQWTKPRKLKKPLDNLDDCNFNHYSIKMSMYMYLLWKANKGRFKPGQIIIEHVHLKRDPDNDNLPVLDDNGDPIVLKIEKIEVPYLKKEVMAMLKTLKK